MAEGVDGLTRDKTRKPGKQTLPATVVQRVVELTLGPAPGDATHRTGRMLAKAAGVSLRSVQRILETHRLGAASRSHLQAGDRSEVRGEAQGHCWSLRRSARPCGRSVSLACTRFRRHSPKLIPPAVRTPLGSCNRS